MRYLLLTSLPLFVFSSLSLGGTKDGGGADRIEPLFLAAQKRAAQIVGSIDSRRIDELEIPETYKTWLRQGNHLSQLQFFTEKMDLKAGFQEPACLVKNENGELVERGAGFDDSDPDHPVMCVSYSRNQKTTPDQAAAMVIHEAGHFAHETRHLFLSALGNELIAHPPRRTTGAVIAHVFSRNTDGSVTFSDLFVRVPRSIYKSGVLWIYSYDERGPGPFNWYHQTAEISATGACRALGFEKSVGTTTHPKETRFTVILKKTGAPDQLFFETHGGYEGILQTVTCAD